ncbi:hypothetical protein RHGRI_000845 [Rhododendron griersonianum]|uniref:Uncharacterized protein n=1 Tax=Rhododendron griersonianum TaxID=479676 RepID=A0AAV6LI43_9ERIC|nr:hypothetical protein RHGRI_000845 [Rhododendron griersonianum]
MNLGKKVAPTATHCRVVSPGTYRPRRANWDSHMIRLFLQLAIKEIEAEGRGMTQLSNNSMRNIAAEISARTREQNESVAKFCDRPLEHKELMQRVFEEVTATGSLQCTLGAEGELGMGVDGRQVLATNNDDRTDMNGEGNTVGIENGEEIGSEYTSTTPEHGRGTSFCSQQGVMDNLSWGNTGSADDIGRGTFDLGSFTRQGDAGPSDNVPRVQQFVEQYNFSPHLHASSDFWQSHNSRVHETEPQAEYDNWEWMNNNGNTGSSNNEFDDDVDSDSDIVACHTNPTYAAKATVPHVPLSSKAYLHDLMNSHDERFQLELCMPEDTFAKIVQELQGTYGWSSSRMKIDGVDCFKSFAMFMYLLRGHSNWRTQERFQHSGDTVSRHVHKILACMRKGFIADKLKPTRRQDETHEYLNKRDFYKPFKGESFGETGDAHGAVFELGAFVGDLAVEEDASIDDISLEGLEQELEECKTDDVVTNILSKGTKLREYTKGVENNLRQVELDSIQDYINESDNLVSLHDQIRDCDIILSQMETLLGGFQVEIGSISSDIKILQEKSMDMGLKLKNRKVAESKLAKFVEDIIIPPRMIDIIVDGEVSEEYTKTLESLSKKLKFVEVDPMLKTSKALKDVQPELERLRQKAVSKVFEFIVQKLYALRKPKTNIQILQQSVLLKYKAYRYIISFLKEHGKEVYTEVRAAYVDTMNKVLSAHFRAYIQALEKLQLDIATSSDLIGPFAVVDEHFNSIIPYSFDAIGLMLMIRIIHQHQLIMSRRRIPCLDSYLDKVNIALWPRFKIVFDMHLSSLRNANVKTLWEDDVHPHYVMRRYAEFTASLIHLNFEYGDGQLELNLERLRIAVDDLLVKLAKMFRKPKLQTVFLINNYDMTISVLKEAGPEGGKIQLHFEELLKNNTAIFVEELLLEHFSNLIKFVKTRPSEDPNSGSERPITVSEVEPLVKDFSSRWKAAIELMHNDVITSFSNFLCGMEILRASLTQLLLYYTRLSDCIKRVVGGSSLNKDLVSISSIMYEIKKYSRTF